MDKPKRQKTRPLEAGSSQSPTQASSSGDYSPVTQTGDNSPVTQTFNQNQYFDKTGRDWNLRLIPASGLKLESFKLGDPTAATFSYVITPVFDTVCQALRDASDEISKARRGLLLLSEANWGKTRLALEALKVTLPDWPVLCWKSIFTKDDIPPSEFLKGKHLVLFIDDLQDYISNVSAATLDVLIEILTQATRLVVLVVTCRIENQEQAKTDTSLFHLFNRLRHITLPSFPADIYHPETIKIIDEFKKNGSIKVSDWDGTPGSLVLGLSKKQNQYLNLPPSAKTVLQAMKLLKLAGVEGHTEPCLRAICTQVFEVDDQALWREAVHFLTQRLFVWEEMNEERWETSLVIRKDSYFEQVVKDYPEPDRPFQLMQHLVKLREVFKNLKNIVALFSLANSFQKLELPKQELTTLDEAIVLAPSDPRGWMLKGLTLARLQRYEEAVAVFTRALDIDNGDEYIWTQKGLSLAILQRHEEALIAFDRSLEIEPGDQRDDSGLWIGNRAWYYKGLSLTLLKRYEEALVAFEHSRGLQNPSDIEYTFFTDHCMSRLSSQENQRHISYGGTMNILSSYENGPYLRHEKVQKECKKLLACIDQVLVVDSDDVQLWHLRGLVLYLMERYEEAVAAFNSALTFHSNFLDAWYLKGISLCMLKRYEEALDAFDHGWTPESVWLRLFMFSREEWAWYLKGVSLERVKGREQALAAFEHVADMFMRRYRQHPHPYLVSNDGFFQPESLPGQQKLDEKLPWQPDSEVIDQIIDLYLASTDRIIALYPDDILVRYYKGVTLYLMERYEEALVAFDRTLELDPHYIDAWLSKGYSFEALGQYNEKAEAFCHVPNTISQHFKGYSLSVWQRYLGAFDRTRMYDPDDNSAWVDLYESVRLQHIRDPQIIREIAYRFEALANDVEAAVKVGFDSGRAAQSLHKQADLLESLNIPVFDDEGEAQWSEDSASSDRFLAGG